MSLQLKICFEMHMYSVIKYCVYHGGSHLLAKTRTLWHLGSIKANPKMSSELRAWRILVYVILQSVMDHIVVKCKETRVVTYTQGGHICILYILPLSLTHHI